MPTTKPLAVAAAAAAALLAAGCGTATLDRAEVERQAAAAVTQQVGQAPDRVVCPEDLEARAGATMACVLVAPDQTELDADVRVTEADGEDAKLAVRVGTQVHPAGELTAAMEDGATADEHDDDHDKKAKKVKRKV